MKKRLVLALLAATLVGGAAVAQIASSIQLNSNDPRGKLGVDTTGTHLLSVGVAPIPSSCGTTPSLSGTDVQGTVTMGTGTPTSCTITFANAWGAAPNCVVQWQVPLSFMGFTTSTTAITLTQTATSSNKVSYFCMGNQ